MSTTPQTKSLAVAVLHEAIGCTVTVELESGETFTGRVTKIEENMNIEMEEVTHKYRNSRNGRSIPSVYLRGSNIVFFQLPDAVKNTPTVQAMSTMNSESDARGAGRGFASRGFGGRGRGRGDSDGGRGAGGRGAGAKRLRDE
eukprot:GILI01025782.1.p1 GENE.GILI01025782.1~~GILI01025782.1.p1  ORF type:complete len:143 (+),score=16.38 GILI01025782.1:72-500(+)